MWDLPVRWWAKLRCMLFWVRILLSRACDGRLIRQMATEAVKFIIMDGERDHSMGSPMDSPKTNSDCLIKDNWGRYCP